jgi:hypothetical protein
MRKKRAAYNKTEHNMAEVVIPCYGGPYDGRFYGIIHPPIGYKEFDCRERKIYLWKTIRVEYLDFTTLEKAAMMEPEEESNNPFGEGL